MAPMADAGLRQRLRERAFAASPRGYAYNMADALVVAPTGFFWQAAPKPLSIPSLR